MMINPTDDEKQALCGIAITNLMRQTRVSEQAATDALADLAARHPVNIRADAENVFMEVGGNVIAEATREHLAFLVIAKHEDDPT